MIKRGLHSLKNAKSISLDVSRQYSSSRSHLVTVMKFSSFRRRSRSPERYCSRFRRKETINPPKEL